MKLSKISLSATLNHCTETLKSLSSPGAIKVYCPGSRTCFWNSAAGSRKTDCNTAFTAGGELFWITRYFRGRSTGKVRNKVAWQQQYSCSESENLKQSPESVFLTFVCGEQYPKDSFLPEKKISWPEKRLESQIRAIDLPVLTKYTLAPFPDFKFQSL